MIVYRHRTDVLPPDLAEWEHRDSAVALVSQRDADWQYSGICDPVFWRIPEGPWRPAGTAWECALLRDRGGVVPSRDLTRLKCWALGMPVLDAKGEQWMAPLILTQDGHRAFPVSYAGPDFLPSPTEEQTRAVAIAREARAEIEKSLSTEGGPSPAIACRWASVLLSITTHVSPSVIAELGLLDDSLVRRLLIVAAGLDRRLDAET